MIKSDLPSKTGVAIIIGKSDNQKALENLNVLNLSSFSSVVKDYTKNKIITNGSLFLKIDSITSPQLIHFLLSEPKSVYNNRFFIYPDDTLRFEIKNNNLIFVGKKSEEYNFYNELSKNVRKYNQNFYNGSLQLYKKITDSIFNEQLAYFNHYVEEHQIKSPLFIKNISSDLKYEHVSALLLPNKGGLNSLIQDEFQKNEEFFDMYGYIGTINLEELNDEDKLNLLSFRTTLFPLISNYLDTSGNAPYTLEKLSAERDFIDKNFDGRTREFIYSYMIFQYHMNGFGNSEKSQNSFKELIEKFKLDYPKTPFIKINEIKKDLESFEMKLSEFALDAKLLNYRGDTLTVREILKSSKKIKIMDFWASWCAPCVDEIKSGINFKDKLIIENDIQWIYISIDENQDKWLKKSSELKSLINSKNNYRVLGGKDSGLMKFFKISWIPRYVILDKNDRIILNNAPMPSNHLVFKKIIEDISPENE